MLNVNKILKLIKGASNPSQIAKKNILLVGTNITILINFQSKTSVLHVLANNICINKDIASQHIIPF